MNTHFSPYPQPSRLPAGGALPQMIGRFIRSVQRAVRPRRHWAIPSEMPDYLLKDIGISRLDILSVTKVIELDSTRRLRG
jgi:uncharacterized protein YjiS (DUF1127 family)